MNMVKAGVFGAVLTGLMLSNAMAHDRVRSNINSINIGVSSGFGANVITHYPNTVIYSRTPRVIYYGPPTIIQYGPVIQQVQRGPQHQFNYYRNWSNGWKNRPNGQRYDGHIHQQNHQRRNIDAGHYRGRYESR